MVPASPAAWRDSIDSAVAEGRIEQARALGADGWFAYVVSDTALVGEALAALGESVWQADPWLLTGMGCVAWNAPTAIKRSTARLLFDEAHRLAEEDPGFARTIECELIAAAFARSRGRFDEASDLLARVEEQIAQPAAQERYGFEGRARLIGQVGLERLQIDWHAALFDGGESELGPVLALADAFLPHDRVAAFGMAALYALRAENHPRVREWVARAREAAAASAAHGSLERARPMSAALLAEAMMHLERAEFEDALVALEALDGASAGGEWRAYRHAVAAAVLILRDDAAGAKEHLRLCGQLVRHWSDGELVRTLMITLGIGADLQLGLVHHALVTPELSSDARHTTCAPQFTAWIRIAEGRPDLAVDALAACFALGDDHARGPLMDVLLADAVARQALGEFDRAASSLDYALSLSALSGFRRAFFHAPRELLTVMLSLAADRPQAPEVSALLDELAESLGAPVQVDVHLSPRERDVLEGLAREVPSGELARSLFLSPNTVKTHTRNLYRKLDVGSREAALERARALGLLGPSL